MQIWDKSDNEKDYFLKKFAESYLLGLNFVSCFPLVEDEYLELSSNIEHCPHPENRIYQTYGNDFSDNIYGGGDPSNNCVGGVRNWRNCLPYLGFIGQKKSSVDNDLKTM